ncbi:MAG: hypothetical protein QNJ22_09700 [Desulfosarcinaceae bacterium]|nr:hypothetical protein [Desulfosarcinaceae bacterium]
MKVHSTINAVDLGSPEPFKQIADALAQGRQVTIPFSRTYLPSMQDLIQQHPSEVQKVETEPEFQIDLKSITVKEEVRKELGIAQGGERIEGAAIGGGVAGLTLSSMMLAGRSLNITPALALTSTVSAMVLGAAIWPKLKEYLSGAEIEVGKDAFTIKTGSLHGQKETTVVAEKRTPSPATASLAQHSMGLMGVGTSPGVTLTDIIGAPPSAARPAQATPTDAAPRPVGQSAFSSSPYQSTTLAGLSLPLASTLSHQLEARERELAHVKAERDRLKKELTELKAQLSKLLR